MNGLTQRATCEANITDLTGNPFICPLRYYALSPKRAKTVSVFLTGYPAYPRGRESVCPDRKHTSQFDRSSLSNR